MWIGKTNPPRRGARGRGSGNGEWGRRGCCRVGIHRRPDRLGGSLMFTKPFGQNEPTAGAKRTHRVKRSNVQNEPTVGANEPTAPPAPAAQNEPTVRAKRSH